MSFHLLYVEIIFLLFSLSVNAVKVAVATQGKARDMEKWTKLISAMTTRNRINLFLLSYDKPIDSNLCSTANGIHCSFKNRSTWTSGRNELSRNIAQCEIIERHHFKYWLFSDSDFSDVACENLNCEKSTPACCYDSIVNTLLSPQTQYAIIGYFGYNLWKDENFIDRMGFYHYDCTDAALQAFHRAVVPVALPYIELLENRSWISSQSMLFLVTMNCFPTYAVHLKGLILNKNEHSTYPNQRLWDWEITALKQVFKSRGLNTILPPPINALDQGNCSAIANKKEFKNASWRSGDWQKSFTFTHCIRGLSRRFDAYVNGTDLVELDGARF